jgi:putative sigma-54 modulation protein
MKITTKKTLDVTPSLEVYIEKKLAPLGKFLKHFEESGELELWLEVSRTSAHHKRGEDVFMAAVDLRLPKKALHAEASAADIRTAIDNVRETIQMEIEKYKDRYFDRHREEKKQ